jgi:DNA-directed RNA polymerase specialized sigma24 family protein
VAAIGRSFVSIRRATFQPQKGKRMSPQAGTLLLEQIAPRLRSVIPKVVHKVGAEDDEELVQDALVTAAQLLDAVERNGKTVTAGNIAYYTVLHMKSGRRSQCRSRADTMAPGTQLDHKSCVLSMEEEVGYDPELDEPITLGELLTADREDPSTAAGRNLDWELFIETHDYRYGVIIKGFAQGRTLKDAADECGLGYGHTHQIRRKLETELREFMGAEAIADSLQTPKWKAGILGDRERAACQADRRRSSIRAVTP